MKINGTAVGQMADICQQLNIRFIHISTDYVFDGAKVDPYKETDPCHPLNVYGASKLQGEQLALQANPNSIIIRTSWVFSKNHNNFINTVLNLAKQQSELDIVNDQIGAPTWAVHLAELIDKLITLKSLEGGIFNFTGYPWVSRFELAKYVLFAAMERNKLERAPKINAISSQELKQIQLQAAANSKQEIAKKPALEDRPLNCRLDNSKLVDLFHKINAQHQPPLFNNLNMPFKRDWRSGLYQILN